MGIDPLAGGSARRVPPLHLLTGGALTGWFAFHAGGFFPGSVGIVAAALAVAVLLRLTLARRPFGGWSPLAAVVAGAGAALACWVLLSATWSDAPSRALAEFDRVLVYVLAFALLAMSGRRARDLSIVLRWVLLAIVAAAVVGLATRLLPDTFAVVSGIEPARLAYPLTYWNALSVCCALGAVLAAHAASGRSEPPWIRALACAALPVLALGVYFPFSRGGIATTGIGLLAYAILARPRRLAITLLAAGPATALALLSAYNAEALATATYYQATGPAEGHRVAIVLAACSIGAGLLRLLALPLDARLDAQPPLRRRWRRGAVAGILLLAVAGTVAVDLPHLVRVQYDGFVNGNFIDPGRDVRNRLTASGNNGRLAIWRVGRSAFAGQPLHGIGAGTYELAWQRDRPSPLKVVDGHSLYLETLAELGVVGLALLLVVLGGLLAGLARGLRGRDRHAHAAALAATIALLLHAGIDWDWEMPVLFCWLFAAGGIACARPAGAPRLALEPSRLTRVIAGLGCLALALTPATVARSDSSLRRAASAFDRGDCPTAVDAALDSRDVLSIRPEPYEIVGYCDLRAGQWSLALRAMESAQSRAPGAWQYAYGVAVARALAGRDPRPAIVRARRLNPFAPEARSLSRALRSDRPATWRRAAARARIPS